MAHLPSGLLLGHLRLQLVQLALQVAGAGLLRLQGCLHVPELRVGLGQLQAGLAPGVGLWGLQGVRVCARARKLCSACTSAGSELDKCCPAR